MSWLWAYCHWLSKQKENQRKQNLDCDLECSEKEEESDNDDEFENFTAFMNFVVEVTETSSKASEIEKSYESDGTIESLRKDEEDSDEEHKAASIYSIVQAVIRVCWCKCEIE